MLWGGGRERRIVQLITGLNRLGVNQITLILLDDRVDYPEVYDLNVNVIKIKRKNSRDFSVFWKLFLILKNIKPDIVNPWSFMTVFYAAPVSLLLGSSCIGAFIVDSKSPHFFSINGVAKILGFLFCSKIVANSQAGHRAYRTPASKQVVIYNGFNETRLQNNHNSLDKKYKNNTDLVVTMIGRVDPQKDYYTFIDALAILKEENTYSLLTLLGKGQ